MIRIGARFDAVTGVVQTIASWLWFTSLAVNLLHSSSKSRPPVSRNLCPTSSEELQARVSTPDRTLVSVVLMFDREGAEDSGLRQGAFGHREGVIRLVPSPQVGSGWCLYTHQTLRSQVVPRYFHPPLTVP